MNWQSSFSAFSPRVSSSSLEVSSSDSSPDQKLVSPHSDSEVPLSRTHQYKKITKPLLERKRRARINKCLDELKDIMTVALQAEGENVSKLEKADILELTVRHLHKLNQVQGLVARNPLEDLQKFQAGYSSCAQEATTFLLSTPGVDLRVGHRLFGHLIQPPGGGVGPGFPRLLQPPQPSLPIIPATSLPSSTFHDMKGAVAAFTRPNPELKPVVVDLKPTLVQLNQLKQEKTVPVKPEALRLSLDNRSMDPVWKPYS